MQDNFLAKKNLRGKGAEGASTPTRTPPNLVLPIIDTDNLATNSIGKLNSKLC